MIGRGLCSGGDTDATDWKIPSSFFGIKKPDGPGGNVLRPKVYVSSHGKVSLLRELNGGRQSGMETVVASDWPPTDVASGRRRCLGVTRDPTGQSLLWA